MGDKGESVSPELLNSKLETVDAKMETIEQKFTTIHELLIRIEKQTVKTNGSVGEAHRKIIELEKSLPHTTANCPQAGTIQKLTDDLISRQAVQRSYIKTAGIIGGFAGAIGSIIVALIEWWKDTL